MVLVVGVLGQAGRPGRLDPAGSGGTLPVMADRTSSSITVAAARAAVMGVIADFGSYPAWATGVRSAEVLEPGPDGRAGRVGVCLRPRVLRVMLVLAIVMVRGAQVWLRPAVPRDTGYLMF